MRWVKLPSLGFLLLMCRDVSSHGENGLYIGKNLIFSLNRHFFIGAKWRRSRLGRHLTPDGICHSVRRVLCQVGRGCHAQNVRGGIANPAPLRILSWPKVCHPWTLDSGIPDRNDEQKPVSTVLRGDMPPQIMLIGFFDFHLDKLAHL